MRFKLSIVSLSSLIFLSSFKSQPVKNLENPKLLSTTREISPEDWHLPQLSKSEKENLIYSVQTVFNDFYIHRAQKKKEYSFDAQSEANKLSSHMSSAELLNNISYIYRNVHDFHTIFFYPPPAQCIVGGFPLAVKLAYEKNEDSILEEKLIISEKFDTNLYTKFATATDKKSYRELNLGDEILSISNLGIEGGYTGKYNIQDALNELILVSQGANQDALKSDAAANFFSRAGALMKLPTGRFNLTVKRASDGKIIIHEFPWIAYKNSLDGCNTLSDTGYKVPEMLSLNKKKQYQQRNVHKVMFKKLYLENIGEYSEEDNITKEIISFKGKKFAVINIKAFETVETDDDTNYLEARQSIIDDVNLLRKFIIQRQDEIDGLIFDVRGNGGGYGVFPQLIANAFTSEFVANMSVQPLVSKMNRDTFHNLEFARYFKRLDMDDPLTDKNGAILIAPISKTANEMDFYLNSSEYSDSDVLLEPESRFDEDENDELPPEYTAEYKKNDFKEGKLDKYTIKEIFTEKPVAVLTDSSCYSSCDIFAALMKDFHIAKMFGEDSHTGGGGANVVQWNSFAKPQRIYESGHEESIIPHASILPKNIYMSFAWNRIVREKAVDQEVERYIEGVGIIIPKSNVLKPTIKDVLTNDSVIFEKIMTDMIEHASTYPTNR